LKGGDEKGMSWWRYLALVLLFVLWVAFSVGINSYMVGQGYAEWWQILIPLAIIWLIYIGIAYFVTHVVTL
jgi:hypothetical protein